MTDIPYLTLKDRRKTTLNLDRIRAMHTSYNAFQGWLLEIEELQKYYYYYDKLCDINDDIYRIQKYLSCKSAK